MRWSDPDHSIVITLLHEDFLTKLLVHTARMPCISGSDRKTGGFGIQLGHLLERLVM